MLKSDSSFVVDQCFRSGLEIGILVLTKIKHLSSLTLSNLIPQKRRLEDVLDDRKIKKT